MSGNTRTCCGLLRASVSPLPGRGGVQLTSPTVMGTHVGHGHACRRSKGYRGGGGNRVMSALQCWQMDGVLSEAGVSHAFGINRCSAGSSGADPGARGWGWRQVHWEKPARGSAGGNRFPQELATNLVPWRGGKQPLAPPRQPPLVGMRPRRPTLPCKVRCAPKGAAVGASTGTWVPCGMCWGGPCWTAWPGSRYWGEVGMGLWKLLSTAEPKCFPPNHPVHICECGGVLGDLFALVTSSSSPVNLLCCTFPWVPFAQALLGVP